TATPTTSAAVGLELGLGLTGRDLVAPFCRVRLVLLALVANFALAPATAVGLTQLIPIDRPHATGLLLLGARLGRRSCRNSPRRPAATSLIPSASCFSRSW